MCESDIGYFVCVCVCVCVFPQVEHTGVEITSGHRSISYIGLSMAVLAPSLCPDTIAVAWRQRSTAYFLPQTLFTGCCGSRLH